jgi:hypothetical protein
MVGWRKYRDEDKNRRVHSRLSAMQASSNTENGEGRCDSRAAVSAEPQLPLQRADVRPERVTTADTLLGVVGQQGFEPLTTGRGLGSLPRRSVPSAGTLVSSQASQCLRASSVSIASSSGDRGESAGVTRCSGPLERDSRRRSSSSAKSVIVVSTSAAADPRHFAISFSMRRRRRAELTSTTSPEPSRRSVQSVVLSQSLCLRLPALIQVSVAAVSPPAASRTSSARYTSPRTVASGVSCSTASATVTPSS